MDMSKLLDAIQKGVQFAEELAPIISMIPGAGPIVNMATKAAGAVLEVATNVQEKVKEGQIVMSSTDQAELKGYIDRLTAANDELMAYVDES